jgi:hypothetical protein
VADPVDVLFSLPLEEFTAARNRLAKEHGAEIRQISKPTAPAWAVNQLARRHADMVRRLVEAGEEQARALKAGAGMREAQAAERKAIADLVGKARQILDEAGRKATTPVLDRVAATLAAGAQTVAGRKALVAGRLTEELEPAGFEALAGIAPPKARDELADRRRAKEQRERRRRKLRDEAQALEAAAREAEREAERTEAAAGKARMTAARARRRADAAAAALADLD